MKNTHETMHKSHRHNIHHAHPHKEHKPKINFRDPIGNIENTLKNLNTQSERRTRSVLKKYPITFSLLIIFAVVSILHGFELIVGKIEFIRENPSILVLVGLIILIGTGSAYKALDNQTNYRL